MAPWAELSWQPLAAAFVTFAWALGSIPQVASPVTLNNIATIIITATARPEDSRQSRPTRFMNYLLQATKNKDDTAFIKPIVFNERISRCLFGDEIYFLTVSNPTLFHVSIPPKTFSNCLKPCFCRMEQAIVLRCPPAQMTTSGPELSSSPQRSSTK